MEPYITVVAAPALATLGKVDATHPPVDATHPPGLSLSDFWDNSTVLTSFGFPVNQDLHCPLKGAAEGASRKVKLPGIMDFMKDTQPLFFPYGEQVAAFVQLVTEPHY
jgi:hypothetical protein